MIYVIAYPKDNTNEDLSEKTTAPVELDEQLDVSLDSGELGYLKTEAHTAKPLAPLSKLTLISQPNQKLDARFVAFDSRALVRKDVVTTSVTDNSAVTNVSVPPLRYNHTASGEISVDGDNVGILRITGNVVRTYPRATFANGKITWSVQWRDTTEYPDNFKYVVAITYTSSSDGIYSHRLSMTEPSKLLQGVMIDGFGVTQPEQLYPMKIVASDSSDITSEKDGTNSYKHTASGTVTFSSTVKACTIVGDSNYNGVSIVALPNGNTVSWTAIWQNNLAGYGGAIYNVTITATLVDSLLDVVKRLFKTATFDETVFTLTADTKVTNALAAVASPEFKWNTQTSVWECLVQIGAVIDAIPRLVEDASGNLTVVTFEFVNSWDNVLETLDDGSTNVIGESVEESQYNTSLSSIVENLREGK